MGASCSRFLPVVKVYRWMRLLRSPNVVVPRLYRRRFDMPVCVSVCQCVSNRSVVVSGQCQLVGVFVRAIKRLFHDGTSRTRVQYINGYRGVGV